MASETLDSAFGGIDQALIDAALHTSGHSVTPTTALADLTDWQLYQFNYCRPCPKAIYRAILDRIEQPTASAGNYPGDMLAAILHMPAELIDEDFALRIAEILGDLEEMVQAYQRWRNDPAWGPYNRQELGMDDLQA